MPVYSNTREACARWPSLAALRIPSILLISRANSYLPAWGSIRRLQRNPELGAHVVEHDSNGLDDQLVRVGLTINNDLVLRLFCSVNVEVMRFGEPVVPAAVSTREQISIILEGACQLQAGQF